MKTTKLRLLIVLMLSLLISNGCMNGEEVTNTNPQSFIRIEEVEEEDDLSALNYIVAPQNGRISVLYSMDEEYNYYDLEEFEEDESAVRFAYNGKAVELRIVTDDIFEDVFGNRYRMSKFLQEE